MHRTNATIAMIILLLGMSCLSPETYAQATIYRLYLPIVQQPAPQISGEWQGAATQTGTIFDYHLSLIINGTQIVGNARVSNGTQYAVMSLTGSVLGSQLLLDAHTIIEMNDPPPGGRWCIPTLLLAPDTSSDTLIGTWKQDGCNNGRIYLQRPTAPMVSVAGTWNGTATQASASFGYTLTLNQSGNLVEGLSTTRKDSSFGTMRLKGFVVGSRVILQETQLLQSGGISSWCFKTVEIQHTTPGGRPSLNGPWSAQGCVPGQIFVMF